MPSYPVPGVVRHPTPLARTALRADIQALRGLAVLLVLIYHAGFSWPAAGFLGVDVFFVVSGFLITRLVADGLQAGTFSFAEFYYRRAKRLLPAAYVVIGCTLLAAPWVLAPSELKDLTGQVVGGLTFTTNIVLWRQSGYFDAAAELKPLLHFWSLAIEEQYYLVLPATMALCPRRFWPALLATGLLASLVLSLVVGPAKPDATFFLLPTRVWELAIGSVGALAAIRLQASDAEWRMGAWLKRTCQQLFWPMLATLLVVPLVPAASPEQRLLATMAVCLATLVVLLRAHPGAGASRTVRSLARVGDISYSLYLVHWVLFSLVANASVNGAAPLGWRLGMLGASVALAWLLWRFVEEPVRRSRGSHRQLVLVLACTTLGLAVWAMALRGSSDPGAMAERMAPNVGLSAACEYNRDLSNPVCRTAEHPQILLTGDSHAMHLADALQADGRYGFVQAALSSCSPVDGVAISGDRYSEAWGRQCIDFQHAVLKAAIASPDIEVIVLASRLWWPLKPDHALLVEQDGTLSRVPAHPDWLLAALRRTVEALRDAGKRVVWVSSPPAVKQNTGRCLAREASVPLTIGGRSCEIALHDYQAYQAQVRAFEDAMEAELDLPVIRLERFMCGETACQVRAGDTLLYRDAHHFSREGSQWLGRTTAFSDLVWNAARGGPPDTPRMPEFLYPSR